MLAHRSATLLDDIPAAAAWALGPTSQPTERTPMSLSTERKGALIKDNATKANDTGSPEVEIAPS